MKKIYHNFITKEDLTELKKIEINSNTRILHKPNGIVDRVINALKKDFTFEIKELSYYRLEKTTENGHNWHKDTGSNNHMPWCQVGCSILLESDCEGGKTYYKENDKVTTAERGIFDLIAHTSDVLHKVDAPNAYRLAFLIFI